VAGVRAAGALPADAVVSLRMADGGEASFPLPQVRARQVASAVPWRQARSARGQVHYPGYFWSATMGAHVVYESRLELARLLLADFDRHVAVIAGQPFTLTAYGERFARDVRPALKSLAQARKSKGGARAARGAHETGSQRCPGVSAGPRTRRPSSCVTRWPCFRARHGNCPARVGRLSPVPARSPPRSTGWPTLQSLGEELRISMPMELGPMTRIAALVAGAPC
jgi:hypothetical protein